MDMRSRRFTERRLLVSLHSERISETTEYAKHARHIRLAITY